MKIFIRFLLAEGCLVMASACSSPYIQPDAPIEEVPFTAVHLTDSFWAPRIETNRTVSIPSAFKECERNGRFDNFAIAGGLMEGEHRGDFSFDDTDPYKVIEGASYSLAVKYDEKLDAYLDSVIHIISEAQEPDGYLTTCVTNRCTRLSGWWGTHRWEKINSHELYNSGHLYEAAVAHYKATGKRTLFDVALRNADLVCKVFGPGEGQKHVPSGHPIVEMALAKLYKVTGDKKYLDMARYFIEETGRGTDGHRLSEYSQDHKPILQQNEIVGHAVRAGYLYSGVADVAALSNDTAYFHALEHIWGNMVSKKMYITGGIGSRAQGEGFGPNYELHNQTAYCETCASIANVFWNHRMFLATGHAKYEDVLERASTPDTLVIPILNVYGTGPRIGRLVPSVCVLDGCIYIVGFVSGEGEITQMGTIFRMVFGARPEQGIARERLDKVADELRGCGIKVDVSDDINRDTFIKWAFISAMACTGAYHDVPMGEVQHEGEVRDTFVGLSRESAEIGRRLGVEFPEDPIAYNLKVIDKLDPHSTASMQKDIARGHESEIQGLLFDMIDLGERLGVELPTYRRVAQKFRKA